MVNIPMQIKAIPVLLAIMLSGCTTVEVMDALPCPPRPALTPITEVDQKNIYGNDFLDLIHSITNDPEAILQADMLHEQTEESARLVLSRSAENQLLLKKYAKKLEARAGCEVD